MELSTIGSGEPHVLRGECAWVPVSLETTRIVGKEHQALLKEAHDNQQNDVRHKQIDQKHR